MYTAKLNNDGIEKSYLAATLEKNRTIYNMVAIKFTYSLLLKERNSRNVHRKCSKLFENLWLMYCCGEVVHVVNL